jgi:glutathione S-transferase
LFQGYAELSEKTPLQHFVNKGRGSLAAVQELASMYQVNNAQEYQQQILEYISDWETTASVQVEEKVSVLPKLRDTREHYETKLESIRAKVEHLEISEKSIPKATQEKLERTEEKLGEALRAHEDAAGKACFILDQVVRFGWKDLYPLVNKMIKWELNKLGREEKSYGQFLPDTVEQLEHLNPMTVASMEEEDEPGEGQHPQGPRSFYGDAQSISDYLEYLPSFLPHLFLDDACPFAQRTWIAFLEQEIDPNDPTLFQLHRVCYFLGTRDPGYRLLETLGMREETPVLLHNGNVFKGSSCAISEYIDSTFQHKDNNKPLSPSDPVEAFNVSLCIDRHAPISELYFQLLESSNDETASSALSSKLLSLLVDINTDLQKVPGPYLCGHQFTLADICIFPFVERIQVVLSHYCQFEINPFLSFLHAWYAKVASRTSVQITMADRSRASMSTSVMQNQTRNDYLVEYYECYARNEVTLAKELFQQHGAPGENAYREYREEKNQKRIISNGSMIDRTATN